MRVSSWLVVAALASAALPARAEVVDAADNGFVIRQQIDLLAPKEIAWRMLVGHIGEWWDGAHTYSGSAANLYIEERPLGCFCERLGQDDAVVHLTVTAIQENALLRLTGGLGPLGLMGVDGNMTFSFGGDATRTQVAMEYRVGGYDPDGLAAIAPAVDATLAAQLERFVRFVESGSPEIAPMMEPFEPDELPEGEDVPELDPSATLPVEPTDPVSED